jgi:hypothetical protein
MKKLITICAIAALMLAASNVAQASVSLSDSTLSTTTGYYADWGVYVGYDVVVNTSQTFNAQSMETHVTGTWNLTGLTDSASSTWVAVGLIPKSRYDATWTWGDPADSVYPNTLPGSGGEYVFNRGVFQLSALEGDWYYAKSSDFAGDYYGFPSVYEYWAGSGPRPPGMAPAKKASAGGDATFSFDMRLLPYLGAGGNMNLAVTGGTPGYTSIGYELGGTPPTAPDGTGYDYGKMSVWGDPLTEDFSECYLYAALLVYGGSDPGPQSANFSNVQAYTIPAPGAILLGGIGVGLVGWLKRRRTI